MGRKKEQPQAVLTKRTGWPAGLMQDDSRELSRWFASRLDARKVVRRVCAEIAAMKSNV